MVVRCRSGLLERFGRAVRSRTTIATSFMTGTRMLAVKTRSASGYIFEANNSSTPPMIVLGSPAPSWITVSTG